MRRIFLTLLTTFALIAPAQAFQGNFANFDFSWSDSGTTKTYYVNPLLTSITPTKGSGGTFTRNSVQWNYAGSASVTANNPMFETAGYLSEPAGTNLVLRSNAFTMTWSSVNQSFPSSNNLAPDGTSTAWKAVPANGATNQYTAQAFTTTNGARYTFSIYAKAGEWNWISLGFGPDGFPDAGRLAWFNLAASTVGTAHSGVTATIVPVGSGWYRCSTSATADASILGLGPVLMATNADNTLSVGSGSSGIYVWGAQVEQSAAASSYIPTTSATVTRASTVLSYPVAGNLPATGPWVVKVAWKPKMAGSATSAVRYLFSSYTDANNETSMFYDGTTATCRKRIGGNNFDATKALTTAAGTTYNLICRFGTQGVDIFAQGAKGTGNSNTTAPVLSSTFQVGSSNGVGQAQANFSGLTIYGNISDGKAISLATP